MKPIPPVARKALPRPLYNAARFVWRWFGRRWLSAVLHWNTARDATRFARYSGLLYPRDDHALTSKLVMAYHGIEKALALPTHELGSAQRRFQKP